MNHQISALYHLPDIAEYEDTHLLTLRENCDVLEEQLYSVLQRLPEPDRQTIEVYMDMRNELEFETVKAALRWGKRNYRG